MKNIYLAEQIKKIDQMAAAYLHINSYQLMHLAGAAIYQYVQQFNRILVVAGVGNNAGDGYVIAHLAKLQGKKVQVWNLLAVENLPADAKQAAAEYLAAGGTLTQTQPLDEFDCVVDALFGIGLNRDVKGIFAEAIAWINGQNKPVIAVDIPSGLQADTGNILNCAVLANITVTVICYKIGLFTHHGKDVCGTVYCEDLAIPASAYAQVDCNKHVLDSADFHFKNMPRKHDSHKGVFGSVVIVGGQDGMLGALMLAGRAALRSGCGLAEVVSHNPQVVMLSLQTPELLTAASVQSSRLITKADVIAIGPGLGLNSHAKHLLQQCLQQQRTMVIDADALTLMDNNYAFTQTAVFTPHPKEAARLLHTDVDSIQQNRLLAAQTISKKYHVVTILKGAGSLIADTDGAVYICPYGYAGMATAGMGDVLTGMVAGLMAQGFSAIDAANTAVLWHAIAAENCHKNNGLIASDVIEQLPQEML